MAVSSNIDWRRSSILALAVAALTLPTLAQAQDGRGRSWGERVAREDSPRQPREAAPQRQAPPPPPQPQQQAQRSWSPPPQSQGDTRAAPQTRWNGGNREGRPQIAPPPQQPARTVSSEDRRSGDWRSRTERSDRADGNRRGGTWDSNRRSAGAVREGDTPQNWRDADRSRRNGQVSDWDRRRDGVTARDRDNWRSRVERSDRQNGGDRNYWRNRNWSGHWDHSRRNWSGWNNHWNWSWGSSYNRWNVGWRRNRNYDWYGYRSYNPSYFQVGVYYAPYRNYSYRRLSVGYFLDELFFGEDYWIADPGYYRLPDAYGPYRWVRYYDDALLVNIYTGEVVDVIHQFFY